MNLNKVFLIGRLTNDPQIKNLPSGKMICIFGLATDRFFVDKEGQKQQQTEFHNIVLFGRLAEIASQYLKKGNLVFIEGRLKTRNWQDANGTTRYRTEIIGERIQLGPKGGEKASSAQKEISLSEEIPIIEEEEIDIKDIPF